MPTIKELLKEYEDDYSYLMQDTIERIKSLLGELDRKLLRLKEGRAYSTDVPLSEVNTLAIDYSRLAGLQATIRKLKALTGEESE